MRTTLNLDDKLLMAAKFRAVEERVSLVCIIENALRESLAKPKAQSKKVSLVTASGAGVKRESIWIMHVRFRHHGQSIMMLMDVNVLVTRTGRMPGIIALTVSGWSSSLIPMWHMAFQSWY